LVSTTFCTALLASTKHPRAHASNHSDAPSREHPLKTGNSKPLQRGYFQRASYSLCAIPEKSAPGEAVRRHTFPRFSSSRHEAPRNLTAPLCKPVSRALHSFPLRFLWQQTTPPSFGLLQLELGAKRYQPWHSFLRPTQKCPH